jgi:uncharacterized membrane protein YgcG
MKNLFLAIIVLFALPSIVSAENFPLFPMAFYGSVTIDGVAAPAGSSVLVYSGTELAGKVTLQEAGVYGYDNPTRQKLVVREVVGELTFRIKAPTVNGGVETGSIAPITHHDFVSGETIEKNLSFVTKANNTVSSGEGGGSSSGGGGGGSSKKKVSEQVQPALMVFGIATSTSEIEAKIILQKQIIVLLTQLIKLLQLQLLTAPSVS